MKDTVVKIQIRTLHRIDIYGMYTLIKEQRRFIIDIRDSAISMEENCMVYYWDDFHAVWQRYSHFVLKSRLYYTTKTHSKHIVWNRKNRINMGYFFRFCFQ